MAKKEYESSVSLEEKSELELLRGQNALLRKQNEILKKSLSNRELNEGKSSTDNVDADRKRDEISESKKRIKHFIEVRFFSEQDVNYLYNVLSVRFLKPQIVLANILKLFFSQILLTLIIRNMNLSSRNSKKPLHCRSPLRKAAP